MKSNISAVKIILVAAIIMLVPSISMGLTYSITDITGINGVTYQIMLDTLGLGTITANVSGATLPPSGDWYIDAILLKLQSSGGISDLALDTSSAPASLGWVATTSDNQVDLQKFGKLPMNGWILFYFNGIELTHDPNDNVVSGAYLDGSSTYLWSFTFDGVDSFIDTPSMQVRYYDGINESSGQFNTRIMSQELESPPVPEPATLLLLGAGLLGLAGFRKKMKK